MMKIIEVIKKSIQDMIEFEIVRIKLGTVAHKLSKTDIRKLAYLAASKGYRPEDYDKYLKGTNSKRKIIKEL